MRKIITFVCVLGIMALAGQALAQTTHYFTDADLNDSNYSTPGNWSNNVVPDDVVAGDNAYIGSNKTCYLTVGNVGGVVPRGFRLRLGTANGGGSDPADNDPGGGGAGTFVIQAPTDGLMDYDLSRWLHFGCYGTGTIIQNSGEVSWSDTDMSWHGYNCTGQSSRYELHGGECTWRSNMMLWQLDGGVDGVSADIIQTGGTLSVMGHNTTSDGWNVAFGTINNSSALYKISGGKVDIGDFTLMGPTAVCTNTTAKFHVVGTWMVPDPLGGPDIQGTINIDKYVQTIGTGAAGAQSILHAEMDSGGSTTIAVVGTATFASGTEVKVTRGVGVTPPQKGNYDILTAAGGITDNGIVKTYDSTFWSVTVGTNAITATFLVHPGDASLDDSVDGADYTLYAAKYGLAGGWGDGDFNNDGAVDGADYTIYAANYGKSGGAIPEPITLTLLGLGGLAMLRRRR